MVVLGWVEQSVARLIEQLEVPGSISNLAHALAETDLKKLFLL